MMNLTRRNLFARAVALFGGAVVAPAVAKAAVEEIPQNSTGVQIMSQSITKSVDGDGIIFVGADARVYRMEGYTPVPFPTYPGATGGIHQ